MAEFEECMKMLRVKLHNVEVTVENFMVILRFAMEVVEVTQLKGSAQKELAIRLVRQIVVEAPITDEKEKLLLDMIDQGVLGNTVDLVVDASKGNVNINNVVKVATGCCAAFCK
tara:strand:- start:283 stop:624 length:342 start_codon:yes stop_codon:yes gene_type:complete